jgi:phosphatidylethanolamine-binding protein (PEBP) family uncharacterized protein
VTILGTLLKNRRAGEAQLTWNLPAMAAPETLVLHSPDFEHGSPIPQAHAGKRVGGENRSPALAWSGTPAGTAQLLLVVQDTDSPTRTPIVHGVALLEAGLVTLPGGAARRGHRGSRRNAGDSQAQGRARRCKRPGPGPRPPRRSLYPLRLAETASTGGPPPFGRLACDLGCHGRVNLNQ